MARARNSDSIIIHGDRDKATELISIARSQFAVRDNGKNASFSAEIWHNGSRIFLQRQGISRKITIDAGGDIVGLLLHESGSSNATHYATARKSSSGDIAWSVRALPSPLIYGQHYGDFGWTDGREAVSWIGSWYGDDSGIFYRGSKVFGFADDSPLADPFGLYPGPVDASDTGIVSIECMAAWVHSGTIKALLFVNGMESFVDYTRFDVVTLTLEKVDSVWQASSAEITAQFPFPEEDIKFTSQSPSGKKFIIANSRVYLIDFESETFEEVLAARGITSNSSSTTSAQLVDVWPPGETYSPDFPHRSFSVEEPQITISGSSSAEAVIGVFWDVEDNVETYRYITYSASSTSFRHESIGDSEINYSSVGYVSAGDLVVPVVNSEHAVWSSIPPGLTPDSATIVQERVIFPKQSGWSSPGAGSAGIFCVERQVFGGGSVCKIYDKNGYLGELQGRLTNPIVLPSISRGAGAYSGLMWDVIRYVKQYNGQGYGTVGADFDALYATSRSTSGGGSSGDYYYNPSNVFHYDFVSGQIGEFAMASINTLDNDGAIFRGDAPQSFDDAHFYGPIVPHRK